MSKPAALVTGATGLLGRQVKLAFERADWPVTGTGFSRSGKAIVKCDLTDESDVKRVLEDVKPGVVVHCTFTNHLI
jgi:dTDP-4-dehydrorhamnose reductase